MENRATGRTNTTAFQTLDQRFLAGIQEEHGMKPGIVFGQAGVKKFQLNERPRKAIQQNPPLLFDNRSDVISQDRVNDVIGNQLASLHDLIDLKPKRSLLGTSLRSKSPGARWINPKSVINLSAAVPLPDPGGPKRAIFSAPFCSTIFTSLIP
jgi:hypothetical protein